MDLEKISFSQGAHYMSNDKCKLPPESFRLSKKGYDEIYIPAVKIKP